MRDIVLDCWWKKGIYVIGWIFGPFIFLALLQTFQISFSEEGVIKKWYQKFIFCNGMFFSFLIVLGTILELID